MKDLVLAKNLKIQNPLATSSNLNNYSCSFLLKIEALKLILVVHLETCRTKEPIFFNELNDAKSSGNFFKLKQLLMFHFVKDWSFEIDPVGPLETWKNHFFNELKYLKSSGNLFKVQTWTINLSCSVLLKIEALKLILVVPLEVCKMKDLVLAKNSKIQNSLATSSNLKNYWCSVLLKIEVKLILVVSQRSNFFNELKYPI